MKKALKMLSTVWFTSILNKRGSHFLVRTFFTLFEIIVSRLNSTNAQPNKINIIIKELKSRITVLNIFSKIVNPNINPEIIKTTSAVRSLLNFQLILITNVNSVNAVTIAHTVSTEPCGNPNVVPNSIITMALTATVMPAGIAPVIILMKKLPVIRLLLYSSARINDGIPIVSPPINES